MPVEKQSLRILDMNGRGLISTEISGNTQLDANLLAGGVYSLW